MWRGVVRHNIVLSPPLICAAESEAGEVQRCAQSHTVWVENYTGGTCTYLSSLILWCFTDLSVSLFSCGPSKDTPGVCACKCVRGSEGDFVCAFCAHTCLQPCWWLLCLSPPDICDKDDEICWECYVQCLIRIFHHTEQTSDLRLGIMLI